METKHIILIVDDTPENLQVLGDMLELAGHEVLVATNGPQALAIAREAPPPDLILLDIMMPGMDGYEVCRQLKADPSLKTIPVIFISALGMAEQKIQAFRAGGVDYVTKPFQAEEVVARVHTHLRLTQVERLEREVTERKRAEAERSKVEGQLRQAQKMEAIGTLAGGIAHDFNNILSILFGYTEMSLDEKDLSPTLRENLATILAAAQRAKDLIRQILTFSRKSEQEMQPLQVSLIVKEALKLLRATLPSSITIDQNILANDGVLADPTQIHQILMNLCTNAYHAMRETGGTLAVTLRKVTLLQDDILSGQDLVPGEYLLLDISDTGQGMDSAIMEKIFEPYFTTKGEGEGTGLGLAVVHGIVKAHKGHIQVQSVPGCGTTFQVYLPVYDFTGTLHGPSLLAEDAPLPMGSERIMVIDDEEAILNIYLHILEPFGYKVLAVSDHALAIQTFLGDPDGVDLVITDMCMPGLNGMDLAQKMLAIRPDCPVILCTGYSGVIDRETARAAGIAEYLPKPLMRAVLLRTVRAVLDRR